eukprot:comp21387_c0_seq1/m.46154 comp21387_c0_seq1/g.46154  ORF comp21387_c0_seq1/g.46154 comp21387_c0_seq1/m.46154 type:complete len:372 (+) comp21387_c0_seq1:77-1192(+)
MDTEPVLQQEENGEKEAVQAPMSQLADDAEEVVLVSFSVKWNGREFPMTLPVDATLGDLKGLLEAETDVLACRQKLFGLVKGKLPADNTLIGEFALGPQSKVSMMGTPEASIVKAPAEMDDLPDVVNDLDWDFNPTTTSDVRFKAENQIKLQQRIRALNIQFINPPRPGKRLLVLDLDYTLWDHKTQQPNIEGVKRPFCDEMMASAYEHYDIAIWSQTHWSALEAKITELGFLTSPRFKICFVLDRTMMFSVTSNIRGKGERVHEVKALDLIWAKIPQYHAGNTVHVDDLARNFVMNPKQGLQCEAYRNAPVARQTDKELLFIAQYLTHIATAFPDFSAIDHRKWREYVTKLNANGGSSAAAASSPSTSAP